MERKHSIIVTVIAAGAVAGLAFATLFATGAPLGIPGFGLAVAAPDDTASPPLATVAAEPPVLPPEEPPPSSPRVRVLIVPGHDMDSGGTSFSGIYERDLAVTLGEELRQLLAQDGRFEVRMTRDVSGWDPEIAGYIDGNAAAIAAWRDAARAEMHGRIADGEIERPDSAVGHNTASDDVSVQLYGITKWANENEIDLMVHLHFNDAERPWNAAAPFSGVAVYVPDPVYGNAVATRPIAESVFRRLSAFDPVSDLPGESTGIVDEPRLIAVGMNDTAVMPSMLIEYGYIYEYRFIEPSLREAYMKELAYQTYRGLRDAYGNPIADDPAAAYGTTVLPHHWPEPSEDRDWTPLDILATQSVLILRGTFPKEIDGRACARTGTLDACTEEALSAFRTGWGVVEDGGAAIGPVTAAGLNALLVP